MKAVFLDRDGTINKEVDLLRNVRQLRVLPGAAGAINKLNRLGFLAIVVTNQAVIARGWLTEKEVEGINGILVDRLARKGARIDAVYYCPHHPEIGSKKYRFKCRCRKPNTGLIKKAAKEFGIDLKKSFFIGDSTRDMLAGKRAGLKTILVRTGYAGKDGKYAAAPDFICDNLKAAADIVKKC